MISCDVVFVETERVWDLVEHLIMRVMLIQPRASPSPGPLCCSTRIKKPPVEFWKLPKDRTPPVPEADDEVPESDDDMHIANKAAMCALSDQELVEYA